jgi:hypothetical protein
MIKPHAPSAPDAAPEQTNAIKGLFGGPAKPGGTNHAAATNATKDIQHAVIAKARRRLIPRLYRERRLNHGFSRLAREGIPGRQRSDVIFAN